MTRSREGLIQDGAILRDSLRQVLRLMRGLNLALAEQGAEPPWTEDEMETASVLALKAAELLDALRDAGDRAMPDKVAVAGRPVLSVGAHHYEASNPGLLDRLKGKLR